MLQRVLNVLLDWSPIVFAWILAVAMVMMVGWMFGVR